MKNAILQFVAVTIPPVLLYLAGWLYLHYYLEVFDIQLSEVDVGLQTVYVYAVTPFRIEIVSHWLSLAIVVAVSFVISLIVYLLRQRQTVSSAISAIKLAFGRVKADAPLSEPLLWVCLALAVVVLTLGPLARSAAIQRARHVWEKADPTTVALLAVKSKDNVLQPEWATKSYQDCLSPQWMGLVLIFADKDKYFFLCKEAAPLGLVFEVGNKGELLSVRYVSEPGRT